MRKRREPTSPQVRRQALDLLRSGTVTLPELAELLGVSTQTVWNWCREEGLDWRKARQAIVAKAWTKASK